MSIVPYMIEKQYNVSDNMTICLQKNIMKRFGNALYPIDYALYKEEASQV